MTAEQIERLADRPDRHHRPDHRDPPAAPGGVRFLLRRGARGGDGSARAGGGHPRRHLGVSGPAAGSASSGAPSTRSTPPTWSWPRRCGPRWASTGCSWWWPTDPGRRRASARSRRPRTASPWWRRRWRGWPGLEPSRIEIDRGGPSYTVDTVRQLLRGRPGGRDHAGGRFGRGGRPRPPGTRRPALRDLVTLAVVGRPGAPPASPPPGWRAVSVPVAPFDVSSTELRRRLEQRRAGGRTGARGGDPLHPPAGSVRYGQMSVRPTQTKSGYPRRSRQPYPVPEQDPATDPEVGPDRRPDARDAGGRPPSRRPSRQPSSRSSPAPTRPSRGDSGSARSRGPTGCPCGPPGGPGAIWPSLCGLLVAVLPGPHYPDRGHGPQPPLRPRPPAPVRCRAAAAPAAPDPCHADHHPSQTRDAPASEGGNR